LRRADPTDIDRLCEIETAAFAADRLSRRSLSRLVDGTTAVITVATEADRVVGYAAMLLHRKRADARLYSIAVDPRSAGRGIGRLLLDSAERSALVAGTRGVRLEVRQDNAGAIQLYRRAGYHQTGSRPGYYADGMAALTLRKGFAQ
jgi:ribosomal protein S18 acetylase RimI-like enzyme